ncbi:MAG: GGDEF domain-containing protein [Spirochaetes bacterium]|nr:GGDEF domain-containing protein [Spirochaetota bacterium]
MKNNEYTIGYLTLKLDDAYLGSLWEGVHTASSEAGIKLVVLAGYCIDSPNFYDASHNIVYDLVPKIKLDGLIISGAAIGSYCGIKALETYISDISGGLPVVSIAADIKDAVTVCPDNRSGVSQAINHLIKDHGCKTFAFLAGPPANPESNERLETLEQTLKDAGLNLNPELLEYGNFYYPDAKKASFRLLDKNIPFDALFAANDDMALSFIDACKERGVEVPGRIRVIGLDNGLGGKCSTPRLSSIDTQISSQGAEAVEILINLLNNRNRKNVVVPSSFVKRESCGCALSEFKPEETPEFQHNGSLSQILHGIAESILTARAEFLYPKTSKDIFVSFVNDFTEVVSRDSLSGSSECVRMFYDFFISYVNKKTYVQLLQILLPAFQDAIALNVQDNKLVQKICKLIEDMKLYCVIELERMLSENFRSIKNISYVLQNFNQKIQPSQTFDELSEAVIQELPFLNVKDFFILQLMNPPQKKGMHYAVDSFYQSLLISGGEVQRFSEPFDSIDHFFNTLEIPGWIIMPILWKNEQFGFMGMGLINNADLISEPIATTIGGVFKNIQIVEAKRIAEQKLLKAVDQLAQLSVIDELTGLYNRRGFLDQAKQLAAAANRSGNDVVVLYADLDNLKKVNDTWGHAAGDEMIKDAAMVFKSVFRQTDIVGRMGGDEFAIACKTVAPEEIIIIEKRLDNAINNFNNKNGKKWELSMSIGAGSMFQTGITSIPELLEHSDQLLYNKKRSKKMKQ